MGKPYSEDLRERVVAYAVSGHSARAASRVFGVSASTAVRLVSAHRHTGTVAAKPQGRAPGTVGKLAPHTDFLIAAVRSHPDITLRELTEALEAATGVRANLSSIHRALVRAGYSYKKRFAGTGA
jgi:transposase